MLLLKQVLSAQDIKTTARLAERIWHEHYDELIGCPQVDYMVACFQSEEAIANQILGGTLYKLAIDNGEPVGYYAAAEEPDSVFLSKIYLERDSRKKGYARAMLNDLLAEFPGGKPVYLHVNKGNTDSIAAYKALGFSIVDSVNTDIGSGFTMDDYVMKRRA